LKTRDSTPAYQQILHSVPAADFYAGELLYLPRNKRAHKLYGMSPVEQIALTVNIALRRDAATLDYCRTGASPDAFATLPKEWTADQIRSFPDYFDALMSGNSARRRMEEFLLSFVWRRCDRPAQQARDAADPCLVGPQDARGTARRQRPHRKS